MTFWLIGFAAGILVVLIVAVLLISILYQAWRILRLARTASQVVAEIDANTRSVWALTSTNKVAKGLLEGASAIDGNAAAIVRAVSHKTQKDRAA
jgi:hypothetical protein